MKDDCSCRVLSQQEEDAHLLKLFTICSIHILIYNDEAPLLLC